MALDDCLLYQVALFLCGETALQVGIFVEDMADFRRPVAFGKDGVELFFERWRQLQGCKPVAAGEGLLSNRVPEAGPAEEMGDALLMAALLNGAHQVRRDSGLDSVQGRLGIDAIEGVGNQVLRTAGGPGGSGDLHGYAIEHQGRCKEPKAFFIAGRTGDELINRRVGEERRQVIDGRSLFVERELPVEDGREFRSEIADTGMPQRDGGSCAYSEIDDDAVRQAGGKRAAAALQGKA